MVATQRRDNSRGCPIITLPPALAPLAFPTACGGVGGVRGAGGLRGVALTVQLRKSYF